MSGMTLVQLRYIVALDLERHFGRAAERCGVSQPTLSTQVRRLEAELGVEIFDRTRQPIEPTDLGQRILERARAVLREAEGLLAEVHAVTDEVAGELRLGVIPTLAPYLLPLIAGELRRRHPLLALHVEEHRTSEILERLERGVLDAGLIATAEARAGLEERRLFREPFVGYVSTDHPIHAHDWISEADLDLDTLWLLEEGHCFRDQVIQLCAEAGRAAGGAAARPLHFESGNLETLKRLVDRGGGMTLLPYLAVADLTPEERARVRPFERPSPSRTVRLVHGRTYLKRALIDALAEVVLDQVPPELRREG